MPGTALPALGVCLVPWRWGWQPKPTSLRSPGASSSQTVSCGFAPRPCTEARPDSSPPHNEVTTKREAALPLLEEGPPRLQESPPLLAPTPTNVHPETSEHGDHVPQVSPEVLCLNPNSHEGEVFAFTHRPQAEEPSPERTSHIQEGSEWPCSYSKTGNPNVHPA